MSSVKSTSRNLEECIDTSVLASERIGPFFHQYSKKSGSNANFQYMEEGHFDGGHSEGGHLKEGHLEKGHLEGGHLLTVPAQNAVVGMEGVVWWRVAELG